VVATAERLPSLWSQARATAHCSACTAARASEGGQRVGAKGGNGWLRVEEKEQ
jgi:hypothetical protein